MSDSINIFYSRVGLLSGKMSDCLDPTNKTDVSCQSGLASISSVMRASQLNGNGPVLFLPHIERNTRFVQVCHVMFVCTVCTVCDVVCIKYTGMILTAISILFYHRCTQLVGASID